MVGEGILGSPLATLGEGTFAEDILELALATLGKGTFAEEILGLPLATLGEGTLAEDILELPLATLGEGTFAEDILGLPLATLLGGTLPEGNLEPPRGAAELALLLLLAEGVGEGISLPLLWLLLSIEASSAPSVLVRGPSELELLPLFCGGATSATASVAGSSTLRSAAPSSCRIAGPISLARDDGLPARADLRARPWLPPCSPAVQKARVQGWHLALLHSDSVGETREQGLRRAREGKEEAAEGAVTGLEPWLASRARG